MENISSINNSGTSVGRTPDRSEALMDLNEIFDGFTALEKGILDGSTKEIEAAKTEIGNAIKDLSSDLQTNPKDFSAEEVKMINGVILQSTDMTMIPDQELEKNPEEKYVIACAQVQGVIEFTMGFIKQDGTN